MNTQQTQSPVVATEIQPATETAAPKARKKSPARRGLRVVEVKVEAPKAETVAPTKPEAPVAKVEVEAPAVEEWTCSVTGDKRPVTKMLVLKLGTLDQELGRRTTESDLHMRAVSVKGAMQKGPNRDDLMLLDAALEIVRKDNAKVVTKKAEVEQKRQEMAAFRATVFVGQPQTRDGKTFFRCVQGATKSCVHNKTHGISFVGSADKMQAPSLATMQEINWSNGHGRMVTVDQLANHYVVCPECAEHLIENPQSAQSAEQEINQDLELNAEAYAKEDEQRKLHNTFYRNAQAQQGRHSRR